MRLRLKGPVYLAVADGAIARKPSFFVAAEAIILGRPELCDNGIAFRDGLVAGCAVNFRFIMSLVGEDDFLWEASPAPVGEAVLHVGLHISCISLTTLVANFASGERWHPRVIGVLERTVAIVAFQPERLAMRQMTETRL